MKLNETECRIAYMPTGRRTATNRKIRLALAEARMRQWELAEIMGIREERLSKMLRHELPVTQQEQILQIIEAKRKGE